MVQRKVHDKLGIESDTKKSVKSEKPLSTSQNQESRNKGGNELKKMMKKSRSIKRSEFDCLRSNSMKRVTKTKSRPEKLPAQTVAPVTAQKPALVKVPATQKPPLVKVPVTQKPPLVKIPESPPNYMKSTTSSSARKDRLQVSPQSSKTGFDNKSPVAGRKDLNFSKLSFSSSVSGHKPGRSLTKTSSLRPVRTLTKSSSNKNGRNSAKRSSGATDQNIRRNTCSTTLKDSKFPVYVPLHPGGTESEGTSIPKVCPYTYCSLNGHHHAELPPLKCFLKAKRRLIKTQKSMRQRSLASNKRTPSGRPKEDIDTGQVVFSNDLAIPEDDSDGPAVSKEEGLDFFLEIYAQPKEENYDGSYAERPEDSSRSATSFEDNIDSILEDMDAEMFFLEYLQKEEEDDGSYAPHFTEAGFGMFSIGNDTGESETDYSIFEASGMDWEEGDVVDTDLESEADCFMGASEGDIELLHKELSFKLDDIVRDFYEEVAAQEEIQIVCGDHDDFDGLYQALEVELSSGISNEESNTSNDDLMVTAEEVVDVPEVEVHQDTVLEIQDAGEDVGMYLQESEDNIQLLESVDLETDESVLKSNDLNNVLSVPDGNIDDGAKVAEDKEEQLQGNDPNIQKSSFADEQSYEEEINLRSAETGSTEGVKMDVEDTTTAKTTTTINSASPDQELLENCSKFNKHVRSKRPVEEFEEPREFNPRGPNFLPVEPEEDPETVDLRHQMMDERKNAEEWMLDFALRNVVNKLAPARKKKVALLVEAFEAVIPVPKYEDCVPRTRSGFAHTRYLQACS